MKVLKTDKAVHLTDIFGRVHNYLRISLTDMCNLRCSYCMPQNAVFPPKENLLTADEIITLSDLFVNRFLFNKIKFTGGEPLVNSEAGRIIESISRLSSVTSGRKPVEISITTNGVLLDRYFDLFKQTALQSINISLDSLDKDRFYQITKRNEFQRVYSNIRKAVQLGFNVKVNTVVMSGVNDDEVIDFVKLTIAEPLRVRFIEFMPFNGNGWGQNKVVNNRELLDRISNFFPVEKIYDKPNSTSVAYSVKRGKGSFAFISTVSHPFCNRCNRLRLTADGKLRNCLFAQNELDLITPLRNGADLEKLIRTYVYTKDKQHGGLNLHDETIRKSMVMIGG